MKKKLPDSVIPKNELNEGGLHDLSHQRDMRCVPLAFEVIKILASMKSMPVGSHVNEKTGDKETYLPAIQELMKILIEKDVKITEVTYIFNLVRQGIEFVQTAIDETLNQNMNRVTELVYNLPLNDYNEITVKGLNEVVMRKDKIAEAWKPILEKELSKE